MAARCRSCPALVEWCVTPNGKRIPLDTIPNIERGNIRLTRDLGAEPLATTLSKDDLVAARAARELLYLSHFATCPRAGEHRRR